MARFILDADYSVLIRNEIKGLLTEFSGDPVDEADDNLKLFRAEDMAISQIKSYISGVYDMNVAFIPYDAQESDPRNAHLVMITIDCALYHLYTSLAPNKIPQHRSDRYADVIEWLKDVGKGDIKANLPLITNEEGEEKFGFRLSSKYAPNNNKW